MDASWLWWEAKGINLSVFFQPFRPFFPKNLFCQAWQGHKFKLIIDSLDKNYIQGWPNHFLSPIQKPQRKKRKKIIGCSTKHLKKIFWIPDCTYISQSTVFLQYPTPGYNHPDSRVWSQYRIVYYALPCAGVLTKINPGRKRVGKSNWVFFNLHKYHIYK